MDGCIFCKIANREIPAEIIFEDESTVAFLDARPVNPGHVLVIPKRHLADIFEATPDEIAAMVKTAQKIAIALESTQDADGINMMMNNRSPAGQVVFHAHMHVIPRFIGDGFEHWHGSVIAPETAAAIAKRLRSTLE